ncbi:MAG: hypothetical protein HQL03_10425 [Nitrospirae bacterium]|nr:hypothetical protein [Nitrospirota bacterium]
MITSRDTSSMKHAINRAGLAASGIKTLLWATVIFACIAISLACKTVEGASATAQDAYEPDDTPSQAKVIVIDDKQPQQHNFHKAADTDYVKFYALKGETYGIKVANTGPNCQPMLVIYGADGVIPITYKASRKAAEDLTLEWPFTDDGIYYASISNVDPNVFGSGTDYALSVYRPTAPSFTVAISGNITNCDTKTSTNIAIENATIKVADKWTALSDNNGHYGMTAVEGTQTMYISAEGYLPLSKSVAISQTNPTFNACLNRDGNVMPYLKVEPSVPPGATSMDLTVTIGMDPGKYTGYPVDWWLAYEVNGNFTTFSVNQGWKWVSNITYAYQGGLFTLSQTLPVKVPVNGSYTFYFGIDTVMNGKVDSDKLILKAYRYNVAQ